MVVVKPFGLLASSAKTCLGTWGKIKITYHVPMPAPARLIWLKVNTTPALNLYIKLLKTIDYYAE